jgi:hypothetical protein
MKLLGHESMVTSQRYVDGAGTDTRPAAELNPLHELLDASACNTSGSEAEARRDGPNY